MRAPGLQRSLHNHHGRTAIESATTMSGGGKTRRAARDDGADADAAARPAASCMAVAIVAVVVLLIVASALLFLLSPPPPPGGGRGSGPREPVELAIGIAGNERWLDALRAWAKLACFKLRPAEPRYDVLRSPASVKTAAKESLEMGKETVKHTAESAARATEKAFERTTEKVKVSLSSSPLARAADGDL
ncbi:unnamed protein product [Urochloa humidicola]